ncbi:MAG TPA: hypothetical protein PK733_09040 [Clostridiales bacterium]|nr:hypothetical protein [Clostridiales bacterium]
MKYKSYKIISKPVKKQKGSSFRSILLGINVERFLIVSFFVLFSLLIFTQAILATTGIGKGLAANSNFEGFPLQKEEFLYNEGELVLKLVPIYGQQGEDAKILVNGEEVGNFADYEYALKLINGDVIEIDANCISDYVDVMVKSKSSNIKLDNLDKKYRLRSEVKKIIKVKID